MSDRVREFWENSSLESRRSVREEFRLRGDGPVGGAVSGRCGVASVAPDELRTAAGGNLEEMRVGGLEVVEGVLRNPLRTVAAVGKLRLFTRDNEGTLQRAGLAE
jgi:hypothetical protein